MVKVCNINLNTINKVKNFSNACLRYENDMLLKSGDVSIDAKSVIGIFSLNLLEPMELYVSNTSSQNYLDFMDELKILGLV